MHQFKRLTIKASEYLNDCDIIDHVSALKFNKFDQNSERSIHIVALKYKKRRNSSKGHVKAPNL